MRIYQKLLLGFFSISLLVVLIGVISVATNSQISGDIAQLVESASKEVRGASGMVFALQAVQHRAHELLAEKYREAVEPGEANTIRDEESIIAIEKAVSTFEKWLTFSRDATRSGIQLAEENEELEVLNDIEIAFIKYNNFLSYFITLTESDLGKADEWMTTMLEPSYHQTYLGVREYEEDAEGELVSESLEIIEATDNANQNLIAVTVVALFAAIALGLIISHLISTPLVRLSEAAVQIGTGHLDTRVDIKIKDEVGDLARSFNKMAEDIDARTQELAESAKKLLEISLTDGLTGVANRRCFDETLAQEWLRATRDQNPIALLMVDIDHFKAYNDHYGHGRGDDCLKQVAVGLKTITRRPGDLVARYGGEEFAFILPATNEKGLLFAEKCVETIDALQLPHERSDTRPHITVSVGIAWCTPVQGASSAELLKEADTALYKAKEAGRNQVQTSWPV